MEETQQKSGAGEGVRPAESSGSSDSLHVPVVGMETLVTRLGAGLSFVAAFAAGTTGWYMIGGAYHFDITPWYFKCALCFGWAAAVSLAVASSLSRPKAWNLRTLRWAAVALLLAIAMGSVTYYCHLNEPPEEEAPQDETPSQL